MSTRSRFIFLLRAAFVGWITGFLLLAPFQLLEAARNAGWSAARNTPGLFAELLTLSFLLWLALSLGVACYFCCAFLAPVVWFISLERVIAHRTVWVAANATFGAALMALRAHIWTVLYHDGVGLDNFWLWGVFAAVFQGLAAEVYFRDIRQALAASRE